MIWLFLFGAGVLAFTLSAVSGGGAGLLLMPLLRSVLPATGVPAALSMGTSLSSASRLVVFFRRIHWPMVRWFVPAAVPCVWLGAWLLTRVEAAYLEAALGLFLLSNLPMLLRKGSSAAPVRRRPHWMPAVIGACAGFVSGLTGAVGLLFNRFYLEYGLDKDQIVATRAANEIILHLIKLVLYGLFGLLTREVIAAGAVIGAAALLATLCARRVLPLLSEALFRHTGYAAMVCSGAFMCTGASAAIADRHGLALETKAMRQGFQGRLDWQGARMTLEFKIREGLEYERVIDWGELPHEARAQALWWTRPGDDVVVEEVRTLRKRSYEVYVYREGALIKYHL